jgi:hypothetical protein
LYLYFYFISYPSFRYEIKSILNLKHIKYLKTVEKWPKNFENFIFGTGVPSAKNDNHNEVFIYICIYIHMYINVYVYIYMYI